MYGNYKTISGASIDLIKKDLISILGGTPINSLSSSCDKNLSSINGLSTSPTKLNGFTRIADNVCSFICEGETVCLEITSQSITNGVNLIWKVGSGYNTDTSTLENSTNGIIIGPISEPINLNMVFWFNNGSFYFKIPSLPNYVLAAAFKNGTSTSNWTSGHPRLVLFGDSGTSQSHLGFNYLTGFYENVNNKYRIGSSSPIGFTSNDSNSWKINISGGIYTAVNRLSKTYLLEKAQLLFEDSVTAGGPYQIHINEFVEDIRIYKGIDANFGDTITSGNQTWILYDYALPTL